MSPCFHVNVIVHDKKKKREFKTIIKKERELKGYVSLDDIISL